VWSDTGQQASVAPALLAQFTCLLVQSCTTSSVYLLYLCVWRDTGQQASVAPGSSAGVSTGTFVPVKQVNWSTRASMAPGSSAAVSTCTFVPVKQVNWASIRGCLLVRAKRYLLQQACSSSAASVFVLLYQ
jgi:hypothetical protein